MSDAIKNFAKSTVAAGHTSADTSIALTTGGGAKFPATPFNVVWWNSTDYSDPADDPNVEIVRVTNISTDTLTVTRAQESTSASTKNTVGKTYTMIQAPTALSMTQKAGLADANTFSAANVFSSTLTAAGNAGFGTETNPQAALVVSKNAVTGLSALSGVSLALFAADAAGLGIQLDAFGSGSSGTFYFRRSLGTAASPSNVTNGTVIGQFQGRPYVNGAFTASSTARVVFTYIDSSPNNGTAVRFEGTPAGSTSSAQALQAVGGVTIGSGTNDPGNGVLQLKAQTFASLAAASAAMEGSLASVTDSTTVVWGATITGGGTNHVLAYCDGTNWTVAGK